MARNPSNREVNQYRGHNTNRNDNRFGGGNREFDENTERTARREYGFSDDSDFDSNSSMYRRGRNQFNAEAIDRDFNLNGNRDRSNWDTNRTAREEYGIESDYADERIGQRDISYNRNQERDYDRSSRGNWGGERKAFNRQADYSGMNYRQMEGGFDLNRSEDRGHFNKGPKGWKRDDQRIKEDVCQALNDSYRVDASEIEVSVKDGDVTLSGTVNNRDTKREAERCVENVRGVDDVHNQLRVKRNENVTEMRRPSDNIDRASNLS